MPFRSMRDANAGGEPSWHARGSNEASIDAGQAESPRAAPLRQRAKRVDVQIAQQAMRVATPTNQEIGPWQHQAARLLALAEKLRATGRRDPRIADEAEALLRAVEERQQHLSDQIAVLPDKVAGSSRLEDTARALRSVVAVLDRTLELMDERQRAVDS